MAELATAWVSLRVSTKGMASDTRKALQGLEPEAAKTGRSMGDKLSTGIGSVLKKSAIGVGVAGGAALAAGLHKGIGRLSAIEAAEAKLSGLGNSASDVSGILEHSLNSVKGTSYGLEEAATIAASAVAAGIKPGQELERTLKLTGDAAAIAGTDLQSMGSIINKVATADMMQMDVANQLMDAGIPILQMVGQEMGVTAEEARKMASAGEISFATFQNALEQGVGGAALKMGDTTQGAFKNMGAAAGRLGATLAGPFFDQAGGAFRGITELLDDLNAAAGPAMEEVAAWLERAGGAAADAFARFRESEFARDAMADLGNIFRSLAGTAAEVWPSLVKIGDALGEAAAALGVSAWKAFIAALEVGAGVLGALTGPLELVADLMESQPGLVTAAVAGWMAFRTVPRVIGGVSSAVTFLTDKTKPLREAFAGFGDQMRVQTHLAGMQGESLSKTGAAMEVLRQRTGTLRGGMSRLVDAMGGPVNVGLMAVTGALAAMASASQNAKAHQDALRESSERLAESQHDVAAALQASNGELNSDVWAELEAQVRSTRDSLDSVAATKPGQVDWAGSLLKDLTLVGKGYQLVTGEADKMLSSQYAAAQSAGKTAGESEKAAEALSNLGLSNEQLATRLYGTDTAYQHLRSSIDGSTEGGRLALEVLSGLRSEFEGQQAVLESVGPEYLNLQDSLAVLADSAASADDKLSAMRTTLEILGEINLTAAQNAAEVAKSVDGLGDALANTTVATDEFGRAFQNADGSLNGMNSNTRPLLEGLKGLQDRMMATAAAGGDVRGVFAEIQPELNAFRGQAEAAGIDWDGLLASMALTPEGIETMVTVTGLEASEMDLVAIQNKLEGLQEGAETRVRLEGGQETVDELERLGVTVRDFDGTNAFVKIDSEEAKQNLAEVIGGLSEVESTTAIADIMAANPQAVGAINETRGGLWELDNTTSISDIMAVNGDAEGKIWQTQDGLNQLDATNPLSEIFAENGQAQGAIGDTQDGLDNLGNTHPESKIRVDNQQAKRGIDDTKGWLDRIPGVKETKVVFRAVYEGFRNLVGGSDNASGGAWNGARALPRFARGGHNGYRLPTSGPGTEVTDGFVAFDRNNVPAARLDAGEWIINGRSSEKYNRELAQINAGTFPKLPGYKDGGRADAKELLDFVHNRSNHGQSRSLEGAPYVFGGINWGDCSSAMSAIARFAVGVAPFAERFTTMTEREGLLGLGFRLGRGKAGDLRIGWMNGGPGGGHTSGTLPDGTNVEMGGARGNGQIGGGAAPASHPQYTDHAYLPIHTWQFAGVEGLEGLMPPGASTTWGDMAGTTSTGLYKSPGNSGQVGADQPRTWSDMAAGAVSALVGGQVEDMLGVFGVPNQLPPIVQAWQMLNEKPGGGPSDWDLSTAAAEVKRLDAAIKIREQVTSEAAKALDALNGNGVGNALPSAVAGAEAELDKQLIDLEADRLAYERAQSKLEGLLGARAAAVAEKDLTSSSSASDLASALAPDTSFPDELMRELKVAYDPAGGAEQWRPMVIAALKRNGFAATQREQDLMIAQINTESGGDPNILQQIQDVNSGGNEAQGLLQIIPGTFAAHRDPSLPDDRTDPWANMNAALRYYKATYGMDLGRMWGKGHGYSKGGWINGHGTKDTVPLVGAPGEFIVNRKAAAENREVLEAMNSGRTIAGGQGSVTYNIHTFSLDDAMSELSRREAQHAQTYLGAR